MLLAYRHNGAENLQTRRQSLNNSNGTTHQPTHNQQR